jgi:hypothetical protein
MALVRRLAMLAVFSACTNGEVAVRPDPLAPLPLPAPVMTERFRDAEACAQCHLVAEDTPVLHDATGANVSPMWLWRSSMMALAARDPFYLAVFAEELERAPDQRGEIEALCTRCHAPAGSEEANRQLAFDELVAGDTPAAILGRGGVTCTLCHQIGANNLGDDGSFSGGFTTGYSRMIYGRYPDPRTNPMQLIVNYTPTRGAQIEDSALCGSCHTVIVPGPSGPVVEQATYLEWRSSRYATTGETCQSCHVPVVDDVGAAISTPVASFPESLAPRTPVGKHVFVGGNSYMLRLLADAVEWSGAGVSADELLASARRDEEHLATAAQLSLAEARREGDTLVLAVRVENLTGHKLPTGYPSRRVWLRVTVRAGDQIVFQSGAVDARGALVDGSGAVLPRQVHHDEITSSDQVQVWEAVLVDANDMPTHRALDARRYAKDDRILPIGFSPSSADRGRTQPVGTDSDPTFVAGSDQVTYRLAGLPAGARVSVELCYQALRPETIDVIERGGTPAGSRFVDLARARPIVPVVMATVEQVVP